MKVLRLDKNTGDKKIVVYPRQDLKPIIGLDENITYYGIIEESRPVHDYRTHSLKTVETFNDDAFEELLHIKTYTKSYSIEQLPNETIISNLNNSVGNHLDSSFPMWKQIKYLKELANGITDERKAEVQPFFDWQNKCREERDLKEDELLNDNKLPSFDWEVMP